MADIGELAIFMWKVAGAPPNRTGAPGRMIWAMVIPASTSTVWKTVAPTTVTGAISPISVTGTISTAIPGLDAVDQVLARVLAVPEVAGRGDREDRHRAGDEVGPVAPEELHHLDHARDAVLGERARDDRLVRVGQGHVEAPRVRDAGLDVVVGREGRGEVRDVGQAVAEPDVLDEVGRVREARLAGPVVEHLEPRRARARSGRGRHRCRRAARRRGRTARTTTARTRWPPRRRRAGRGPARRSGRAAARARAAGGASPDPGSPSRPRPGPAWPRRRSGRELRLEDVEGRPHQALLWSGIATLSLQRTPARAPDRDGPAWDFYCLSRRA